MPQPNYQRDTTSPQEYYPNSTSSIHNLRLINHRTLTKGLQP
jgi:hypothetical protein